MGYSPKITAVLNLRKEEIWAVGMLMSYSFFQTIALALFFTAASAIFLAQFPISNLPYVYVMTGALLLVVNAVYARLSRYVTAQRLMQVEIIVLILAVVLFRTGLFYSQAIWLAFGLIVWHRVMASYVATSFNRLMLLLFDVRQSKRLFGLITSTETPANGLGYLLASGLVPFIGTANLLLISVLALLIALVFLSLITTRQPELIIANTSDTSRLSSKSDSWINKYFSSQFVFAFSITCLLAVAAFVLIEFAFLSQVQEQFSSQTDIAVFLGVILGLGQLVAFFIKTFGYSKVLRRFGIRLVLFVLPCALGIVTLVGLIGGLVSEYVMLITGIWVVIMLVHDTLRSALYNNTFISLLQPLPKPQKLRGLNILGNIEAAAIGTSGLVLALFGAIASVTLYHFGLLLLFVLVGWLIAIKMLNKHYVHTLEAALKQRVLQGEILSLNDKATLQLLTHKLESSYPGEVLYALDVLSRNEATDLPVFLEKLLSHPLPEVRVEVLKKIRLHALTKLQDAVGERIQVEEELPIVKEAIMLYCFLGEADVVDEVSPLLDSEEPLIRNGALVGLICFGGIGGVIVAGQRLNEYIQALEPEKRAFAANIIGDIGIRHFYHPLLRLVEDKDTVVRKAALRAAGKINHPQLYPALLRTVSLPEVFEVSVSALIQAGKTVIPYFESEFQSTDYNPVRLRRLIQVCGKIGGEQAIDILKRNLYFKNIEVRNQVLHSLAQCQYRPGSSERNGVLNTLNAELADAAWFVSCIEVFVANNSQHQQSYLTLIINAIETELHHLKKRLLLLLSYLYEANDVLHVWESLQLGSKEKKANALEVLDVLVSKELSSLILPLLEDFPVSHLSKILATRFPQPKRRVDYYLQKLVSRQQEPVVNIWTQAVAIYAIKHLEVATLTNEIRLATTHPNHLVAETACWAMQAVAPDDYAEDILPQNVLTEPEPITIPTMMETKLLAVEKVMVLKTTRIFSETAEDILVDIAAIMKELAVQSGEVVVEKNSIGTCMYIIYEGAVRVHDEEHTLVELHSRDFFGELSLLDTEPRSASVTALEDSLLLRLDQHAFYEIMADRSEVIREIMKILCRRLRNQNKMVSVLKKELELPTEDSQ